MRRAHGTAVSTQASAGRPRPEPSESRGEQRGSGAEGSGGGAAGGGAPRSPPRRRSSVAPLLSPERRGVFETRTVFHFPYRRSSSGYFSGTGDSLPGSPLPPRAVASTQTPSPSAQALRHALARVAEEARDRGARTPHGERTGGRAGAEGECDHEVLPGPLASGPETQRGRCRPWRSDSRFDTSATITMTTY
ncbi:uncharacterized protein LOC133485451 isoform X2 [Phyllopteryx taeniolatus]|uniref:uncharacterized protein LOC133485451 isoform X2 n=1 Tax=Phyllopteryx taeniolatus TaxID=161469 RepID=UPI002AD59C49|nr:uncharacterized protein LOC133485451 isoform X2 [Phyllopteryx taeniolatus]